MALLGRFNSLQIVKHTDFGLYLDGGPDGEILLPRRYIPKDTPTEVEDWLNVFLYLDSEDLLIATTEKPKVQVGEFASLKVKDINGAGIFLDWGLSKDLLMPYSEESRPLKIGDYCVVHAYLDKRTRRITATARLDRYLDITPANYQAGQPVELLVAGETPMGFKAIINHRHWGLIHKNEVFKFLRSGMQEKGFIKEVRRDGKIALSLQPVGESLGDGLQAQIMDRLAAAGGTLAVCDKSDPQVITQMFSVSKGNFKKAIGALFKQGLIVIHDDRIEKA
ncbi:S1-like domain-containing RNA-binding protein [Pseudomonas sp. RP23018S]|uniref:CvfB family protein n=1 Tax=Pseudomonas sp. RP23018S TaxID=3096037 RepID=UPI002ACA5202|nr:S1-like domain-containing RNA-binding protein [Pseudomonas sp. RP23018S]MDZ5602100.1 S1-like domain-containing RNA-binding protein [Pseudomonas sp. RP23018S]